MIAPIPKIVALGSPSSLWLRLRQLGKFGQVGVHRIPRLRARCKNIQGRTKQAGIVQAAGANVHCVRAGPEKYSTASGAERARGRIAIVGDDIKAAWCAAGNGKSCGGNNQNGREAAARFALTIPAVAIETREGFADELIANGAAGATAGNASRHY